MGNLEKSGSAPYSRFTIYGFGALVKVRNLIDGCRKAVTRRVRGAAKPEPSDFEAYAAIASLIPNAACYDEAILMRWLRDRALSKGFDSLQGYRIYLTENQDELEDLRQNLTFVGTHFFRGTVWQEFDATCRTAFATRSGTIKIWCAGCSSGKEAYSVLMMLSEYVPLERIDLLASDYNDEMLARCLEGRYPLRTIDEIPSRYWHFTEACKGPAPAGFEFSYKYQFRFREELRGLIRTQHHDLLSDEYPADFDLILCRNVIKFFDQDAREQVKNRLIASLNAGGILVLSEHEKEAIANPVSSGLEQIGGTCMYRKL